MLSPVFPWNRGRKGVSWWARLVLCFAAAHLENHFWINIPPSLKSRQRRWTHWWHGLWTMPMHLLSCHLLTIMPLKKNNLMTCCWIDFQGYPKILSFTMIMMRKELPMAAVSRVRTIQMWGERWLCEKRALDAAGVTSCLWVSRVALLQKKQTSTAFINRHIVCKKCEVILLSCSTWVQQISHFQRVWRKWS